MRQTALTVRQERFAQEYILTGNASEAYRRAYPKSLKWKENSVFNKSSSLLRNEKVSARVAELQERVMEKFDISAENVIQEIAKLAFADIRNIFNDQGQLLPIHQLIPAVSASISSVKVKTYTIPGSSPAEVEHVTEIKLWDKGANLERLGRHLKLFNDIGSKDNPLHVQSLTEILKELDGTTKGLPNG